MPVLILNNPESPRGLVIEDRVLIGRRPFNTVMVPDPAVSRIHAWIGPREEQGGWLYVHDAGSRGGTLLNGQRLTEPQALADGDEITVGPVTLTYLNVDELPSDVEPLENPAPPPASDPYDGGIYFDCACGGPMWVAKELAGATGKCRYCGERLVVPHVSGQLARPLAPKDGEAARRIAEQRARSSAARKPPASGKRAVALATRGAPSPPPEMEASRPHPTCSICQTDILSSEASTRCPSCRLTFHEQCWQENYGCSAYGCDQVNVLAPMAPVAEANGNGQAYDQAAGELQVGPVDETATPDAPLNQHSALSTPHSSLDLPLLAGSFVAMGLGALAYGIPSAVMVLVALAFLLAGKSHRKALIVVALVVAIVGAAAGYATSMFWWRGVRVWETFLR
jgi:pSer/pThr/pTyr-binding forkhead associated (FHA) protein